MDIAFIVNEPKSLGLTQTTWHLIATAALRGHRVLVAGVDDLAVHADGAVRARANPVHAAAVASPRTIRDALAAPHAAADLAGMDAVVIRTNPAREPARARTHEAALTMMAILRDRGTLVLNDPDGIRRAASKLFVTELPAWCRPATLVSSIPEQIREFVQGLPDGAVLKPIGGSGGQDVFVFRPGQLDNVAQIIDVVLRAGPVVAQQLAPRAEEGDMRVILLEGRIMAFGDALAAVRRVPPPGELRSNVRIGGTPAPVAVVPQAVHDLARAAGPLLSSHGIFLAGLDVVGDMIIEVNAFSPGGMADMGRYAGVDFVSVTVAAIERCAAEHRSAKGAIALRPDPAA